VITWNIAMRSNMDDAIKIRYILSYGMVIIGSVLIGVTAQPSDINYIYVLIGIILLVVGGNVNGSIDVIKYKKWLDEMLIKLTKKGD
jgi:hypothetical protein